LFHGKWLKVEQAVEPSLINWENLGLSQTQRCCRISFATIVSVLLLCATTLGILYAKVQENQLTQKSVTCNASVEITQASALADILLPKDQQSN